MHGVQPEFRLRQGSRILGYIRLLNDREWFSLDGMWWRGHSAADVTKDGCVKDHCTCIQDARGRWVFHEDILLVKWKNPLRGHSEMVVSKTSDGFILKQENQLLPIEELVFAKRILVTGHRWLMETI
ncbi:MAG: hypothetical protein ACPGYK_09995 [Flavobacteriales bacterium]